MALTGRTGLHSTGVSGDTLAAADWNQLAKALMAAKKVLGVRFGGEGIWDGGANVIGDLSASGTEYPAVLLVVYDDSGEAWYFRTTTATAITFSDTDAATGALYAVIQQQSGVSPAAAEGGRAQLQFVAQDNGDAAPDHSLKLGTGTIVSSEFTDWTPEAVFVEDLEIGAGRDEDITITVNNGDGNQPQLKYNSGTSKWQYSHNGTDFYDLPVGSSMSSWSIDGDNTAPQAVAEGETATIAGTAPISTTAAATRTVTVSLDNAGVTYAKMQNAAANTLLGNPTGGAATMQALALAANKILGRSSAGDIEAKSCTDAGFAILDDADAAAQRTTLGLDTMATQAKGAVDIDGGAIDGAALGANSAITQLIVTNGELRYARDANCGPPVAGTYVLGDLFLDELGAVWQCTTGGTPGTWVQITAGSAAAAPVAGDFNGGAILDGYRWFDTASGMEWMSWWDSGAHYKWQSTHEWQMVFPNNPSSASHAALAGTTPFSVYLPTAYDYRVMELTCWADAAATTDVTHYWTLSYRWASTNWADYVVDDEAGQYATMTPAGTTGYIDSSGDRIATFWIDPTNGPGTLSVTMPTMRLRYVLP